MSTLMVQAWKCDKAGCGHVWYTDGVDRPKRCARCKSPVWDREKVDKLIVAALQKVSDDFQAGKYEKPVVAQVAIKVTPLVQTPRVEVEHPPFIADAKCDCCRGPVYESSNPATGVRKWKCQSGHYSSPKQPQA